MNQILLTAWVLLFPAGCTALGAAGVFLLRRTARPCTQRILCGMAAGIMLAASVWSLLLPAIERARQQAIPAWIAPSVALVLGAVGLLQLEQAAGELLAGGSGHGGRMVLDSRPDQGTSVTLALPDEMAEDTVEDVQFDYAGGFQPALVGLADALPYQAFLQKHSDD